MPDLPEPGRYTGETPFVEAACAALGLPHVHPGLLTAMKPFKVMASLTVQAHMAPPEHRRAIAGEAAKQLDVLTVAERAARAVIAHLFASVGLPAPADPTADLTARVAELEAELERLTAPPKAAPPKPAAPR
jgi:uncharacterized small protein (DUF1192 family)